jgi:hypothetical protein
MGITGFTLLALATFAAAALAVVLDWILLRAVFRLMMRLAAVSTQRMARPTGGRGELVRGTALLARAFAGQR